MVYDTVEANMDTVLIPFIAGMFLNDAANEHNSFVYVLIPFIAGMFLNSFNGLHRTTMRVLIPFIAGMFLNLKNWRKGQIYGCFGVLEL